MIQLYKKLGKLTKLSDNSNALRSNPVVGRFYGPPTVGYNFTIYSEPLTPGKDFREVGTSLIKSVTTERGVLIFQTENSTYMLEIFEDDDRY
jgi:hypothetical protein